MEFIASHLWLWLVIAVVSAIAAVVLIFSMFGSRRPVVLMLVAWLLNLATGVVWILFVISLILRIIEYAKHV